MRFGASAKEESQASLRSQASVPEAVAKVTALAKVPGGSITSAELEKQHGKLIWSFDISSVGSPNITEVQVNAKTGKV